MKRKMALYIISAVVVVVMLAGCSRKGVHMNKHRKSRKCNCPTFVEQVDRTENLASAMEVAL